MEAVGTLNSALCRLGIAFNAHVTPASLAAEEGGESAGESVVLTGFSVVFDDVKVNDKGSELTEFADSDPSGMNE